MKFAWLLVVMVSGGMLGYTTKQNEATAASPNACPRYKCKVITYWWDGNKTTISAAYKVGGGGLSSTAWADVFTPASTENGPPVNANNYDRYTFNSCAPSCGKDANGKWQALQEVAPVGAASEMPIGQNLLQNACSLLRNGQTIGDTSTDANDNNNTPPGVIDITPGGE